MALGLVLLAGTFACGKAQRAGAGQGGDGGGAYPAGGNLGTGGGGGQGAGGGPATSGLGGDVDAGLGGSAGARTMAPDAPASGGSAGAGAGGRQGGADRGPEVALAADASAGDAANAGDAGIPVPPGYALVWSDEFDLDGAPNAKNWTYEKGFMRNEELQWYQAGNASVQNGLLVIEARRERVSNPNYQAGSSDWKTSRQYADYTSASLTTSGLQAWQYGRFEMRARIPTSAGTWPAWWTLGTSGEWPSNGEIDIMEAYKGNVLANIACGTATRWQAKWDSASKSIASLGTGWAANFHVWRMDWDDKTIALYLDDALMNSAKLSDMLNADGTSPFQQKAYMLVDLAIGGTNGGDPSSTSFPQRYEVDWIRVYQKQ